MNQVELKLTMSFCIGGALFACAHFSGDGGMPELLSYVLAIFLLGLYGVLLLSEFSETANLVGAIPIVVSGWKFWIVAMWPLTVLCLLVPIVCPVIRVIRDRGDGD